MHILHIYKDCFPVIGGIENHIHMLAKAQADAGHQVTVLACARSWHTHMQHLNNVRMIKVGRLATVASMPLSTRHLLALSHLTCDIAHIHSPYPLGEMSNWLLRRARATVMTYHSDVIRQKMLLRVYGPIFRRILRATDAIIATSPPYVEHSLWLRPMQDRCTVVPLGIDLTHFTPPPQCSRSTQPTLLFVGRLRYYKGLDTLLRAMQAILEARLLIVGDGPMRARWQQLSVALGLRDRVEFIGEVPDLDLLHYYRTAHLFVLPASVRTEAFGTVLLEAMAVGLPVISTEIGKGTSWVNRDGVTGRVVPPNDEGALAQVIRELLAHETVRQRMGEAARARVEANFSLRAMVQGVESVYDQALSRKQRTHTRRSTEARVPGWATA